MRFLILVSLLLSVVACSQPETATELYFIEQETGVEPYETRMIVTREFLRIDDGEQSKDFILYDRNALKIFSVSESDQRIFEIPMRDIELEPPADLIWEHKEIDAANAPAIDGIKPTGHSFSANGKNCLQTMSAKGLLEEARLALIEYQGILAGEHAVNLDNTPAELRTPCDDALTVYHAVDALKYGFPVIEWDSAGHRRQLKNYTENAPVSPGLFKLPEDYGAFTLQANQQQAPQQK